MEYITTTRGIALRAVIRAIKNRISNARFHTLLEKLPLQERSLILSKVKDLDEVSLDTYCNFYQAYVDLFSPGDYSVVIDIASEAAAYELKGIYRMFIRIASPEFVMKRATIIFSSVFNGGEMILSSPTARSALLTIFGFRQEHWIMELDVLGFCKKTLEMCGVKELVILLKRSVRLKNNACCEISAKWQ